MFQKWKPLLLFSLLLFLFPIYSHSYEDSKERRINLWPFLVYREDKENKQEYLEALGPIIYRYRTEEEKGFSLRPLVSFVETSEEKRAYFLTPLGVYREDNETVSFKLIPLVRKRKEKKGSEEEHLSYTDIFPIFWGRTSKNETYWGIFPLYGKLKERFGREEITFFLWPLYSRITYEDQVATNILWPFIRVTQPRNSESAESPRGFKIWPLYGHFKEAHEERKFVLWPFYIRQNYRDEFNNFEEKLYIFPFYLREKADAYERRIYLWPFIQIVTADDLPYRQLDAPWPIYRKITGENIEGTKLYPFFGYVRRGDSYDSFILWPLYFYSEYRDNTTYGLFFEKKHRFLLLSKHFSVYNNDTLMLEEFRLWPLIYSYNNTEKKISTHHFPALIPIIDEGIERNYSPFLKLYETFRHGDSEITRVLWGLYRHERRGNRQVYELAFILRRVCDVATDYIEFFEGLLGFGKIDGKPVLKIFFFDLRRDTN